MRTKVIVTFLLTLFILLAFSGLAGAQFESPTYVPLPDDAGTGITGTPPPGPGLGIDSPTGEGVSTPQTGGGLATGTTALLGLLLLSSALPFKRR